MKNKIETPPANKPIGSPCLSCPPEDWDKPIFSHQLKLVNISNLVPLEGIPVVVCQRDTAGETDKQGNSERVYSESPESLTFLVGKLAKSWQRRQGNFGSLKQIDERSINLTTDIDKPVHPHPYTNGYDYIAVVGARTAPWDAHYIRSIGRGDWGKESPGNQYRFINCGLRQLTLFPRATAKTQGDHAMQRILIVFQQGYTEKDIERINEYTQALDGRIVYVKNVDEMIAFLNQRKAKKRLIKELVVYGHGIINYTTFHYQGENIELGLFGHKEIERIEESLFDYDAKITTYACRNGISLEGGDFTDREAGQKQSPAQKMADSWDVGVKAFEMRSSYVGIYGLDKEIKAARNYGPVIEKYKAEEREYKLKIAKGEQATPPQKPDNYDEMASRYEGWDKRTANEDDGGGPIMPQGAWREVGTGDTPTGLKRGLQDYTPQEWKI